MATGSTTLISDTLTHPMEVSWVSPVHQRALLGAGV